MDINTICLLLVCGLISGVMNTLASSGSAITLPAMVFLGVPPSIANATNRLPVFIGSAISVYNFQKAKEIIWSKTLLISIPMLCGVIIGTFLAGFIDPSKVQMVILVAMVFSFILIITNSRAILKGRSVPGKQISIKNYIIFFLIGIWAGLIVLDSAILLLFELILGCGLDLAKANPIKNFLILIASLVSVFIFSYQGLINWEVALVLSIGSFFGGYFASKISNLESLKKWIYFILIAIIGIEIVSLTIKIFLK